MRSSSVPFDYLQKKKNDGFEVPPAPQNVPQARPFPDADPIKEHKSVYHDMRYCSLLATISQT